MTVKKVQLLLLFQLLSLLGLRGQGIDISSLQQNGVAQPDSAWYYLRSDKDLEGHFNFKKIPLPYINAENGLHILRFNLKNAGKTSFWIKIPFLNCESIDAEIIDSLGNTIQSLHHVNKASNFIFHVERFDQPNVWVQFKIKSTYALFFPIKFMQGEYLEQSEKGDDIVYAMFFGICLIMSLYNIFVYFSTRSISYLYYVLYTVTFGIAQFALLGYFNAFFAPGNFILSKQIGIIFSGIAGIQGILFFNSFLETQQSLKLLRRVLLAFAVSYFSVIIIGFSKDFVAAFNLLNINAFSVGLISLGGSAYLSLRGSRPARFFLVAWLAFMIALVVFVLTNVGVSPYNNFTKFVLPLGAVVEIALLSFALADKINILSKENETLIREQNVILEKQVAERTAELRQANDNLKETQAQLVNSEKMASLGHLTAGIAHEINNPINFISANISPLRRDIEDYETLMKMYEEVDSNNVNEKMLEIKKTAAQLDMDYLKTEIQTLLNGIDEGARRTAEIVKNLKIFSHIDKAEHSYYSVNEGIGSTLHLLSHKLGSIKVIQDLRELPPILCFPGKLNQVFMNILSNAIDALQKVENPVIAVRSYSDEKDIYIEIEDNGHGIPENIIKDIFNPFFTTKDVGSGTGLGLSITISIIQEHGGDIKVESEEGKGTKFIINLPIKESLGN